MTAHIVQRRERPLRQWRQTTAGPEAQEDLRLTHREAVVWPSVSQIMGFRVFVR
jgi:hypothetical protein